MYVDSTITYTIKGAKIFDVMVIPQMVIAIVGIIGNFTLVFAFLNHKQLRRKVSNMFIINQVSWPFLIFCSEYFQQRNMVEL